MSTKAARRSRQERIEREARAPSRPFWQVIAAWGVSLGVVAAVVAAMMVTSQPETSSDVRAAPGFSLTDTNGETVTLDDFRGDNVLLYFSEGAGCQSCLVQMAEIEKYADQFRALDVIVLPIVMNSRDQILRDMHANGVRTPFLLDDGAVSDEYGTLGRGMHAGLPGHSFVLIDAQGQQKWYGEYPSMWLSPQDLLQEIESRLGA